MNIDVEQIDPFSLPSVALGQRDQLPWAGGVYFAILETEILYIGKSVNLRQRWQDHHRINQLRTYDGVIIAWLHLAEEQNLEEIEERCIRHFKPLLNGNFISNKNQHALQILLGYRIRQLRKERKITQLQLSITLGVHIGSIKRWEKGKRWLGPEDMQALASAFSVRIQDLFVFPLAPNL